MRKQVDNVNHKVHPHRDGLLELIHAVMHLYRARQYRFLREGPHDITHMDGKVLGFFGVRPGATLRDLMQHSGRDKAQLARLIKGLREQGLLEARIDENDRRHVRLYLTAQGSALQSELSRQAQRLEAAAAVGLSGNEREQLRLLLQRVGRNLEEAD